MPEVSYLGKLLQRRSHVLARDVSCGLTRTHQGIALAIKIIHQNLSIALTKSRKVSAKNCGQIVANRVRASVLQPGHAYAIAGFALLFDGLLPFGSPS
jgi:hypothetical protein